MSFWSRSDYLPARRSSAITISTTAPVIRNPHDPPKHVSWGERSKDEMAICQFFYTCDNLKDMQRSHQHLLEVRSKDRKSVFVPIQAAGFPSR